jgi:branched-chain amino acid aminotransferase
MAGVFYADGTWTTENPKLTGPMDHAFWMSSVAFDGARSFGGLAPDLDRHCARLVRSAEAMGLKPTLDATRITEFCLEAIRRFPREAELYIRPMFYGTDGFVAVDPDSTRFVLAVYDSPMPGFKGISVCLSPLRRPAPDMAPTDAKASCLYPNSQRALRDAAKRGFDNAVLRDPIGNVAELATANIWIVRDGVAQTPVDNGTFLAGITRNRVRDLLRDAGTPVVERTLTWPDVYAADEAFSTGNYGKVVPIIRIEDRALQPGPVTRRARDLYFTYAETCRVA